MKMRQRLAAVLAATMVLTAVPAVTMAKSDFGLVTGIQIKEKDDPVSTSLKVEMKDATSNGFIFFVNLANAEFVATNSNSTITNGTVTYIADAEKKEMKVTVTTTGSASGTFNIPLNVILKGDDATVAVDGNATVISDMSPIIFAKTSDAKAKVTVGDAEAIYTDSTEVAKITIEESIMGKLAGEKITFTSRNSEYDIVRAVVTGEKGFTGTIGTYTANADGEIVIPAADIPTSTQATGRLIVKLEMKSNTKSPSTGSLNVKVSGDNVSTTIVKVGEVVDYGTIIEMKDKKVVDVNAGKKQDITFTIKETVADTFIAGREFDVTFDKGFLSHTKKATLGQLELGDIEFNNGTKVATETIVTDLITDKDDFVTGFTVKIANTGQIDNTKIDKITLSDVEVYVSAATEGDVTVKVEGRALGFDASTVAINAKKTVDITVEPVTVKVGLKTQVGGKIVLTETDKEVFAQGEYLLIKLEEDANNLELKDAKVKVTDGDLQIDEDDITVTDGVLAVKIKRDSTEASTITVSELEFYTNRSLPQGTYKVEIAGKALSPDWSKENAKSKKWNDVKPLEVKDFLIVGTANTEDLATNGLRKGTSSFVIGSDKFVVNGKETTMDAAAYLDKAGRTMVPLRFVANALGIADTDIFYAGKTATIVAGSKTISVTLGDKVAKLNGVAVRNMDVAPNMINDRVYVPVGEIAALLSVDAAWDGTTQTATFTVK